jgi:hypothetical protein
MDEEVKRLHNTDFPGVRQRVGRITVWLAVRGWLPIPAAYLIIRWGGLSHD